MTYSASGFIDFSARSVSVIDIPVAKGSTMQSLMHASPITLRRTFRVMALVNFTIRLEPTAFGC